MTCIHVVHIDRGDGRAFCNGSASYLHLPRRCMVCARRERMQGIRGIWTVCGKRAHLVTDANGVVCGMAKPTTPSDCVHCLAVREKPEIASRYEAVRSVQRTAARARLAAQRVWPDDFGKIPAQDPIRGLGVSPRLSKLEQEALRKR